MTEPSDKKRLDKPPSRGIVALLLSKEFRALYLTLFVFLIVMAIALGVAGFQYFNSWSAYREAGLLASAILYFAGSGLTVIAALGLRVARRYFGKTEVAVPGVRIELDSINEDEYAEIQRQKKKRAEEEFERNLNSTLVLQKIKVSEMPLFPRAEWNLQPGVNVLLGRNGYGKSLMLRTLTGVLQHDEDVIATILSAGNPSVVVDMTSDGKRVKIHRNSLRFVESIGKVPLLAIPDSRFFDRSQEAIGPEDSETADLRVHGAHHFMYQKPYGSVIRSLLYEICLDYWEHGKRFDLPVFEFLRKCVEQLTGSDFQFSSIERKGRTGFDIRVITEGNDQPLPIQFASQGTLSVLAMFGLIRSYLNATSGPSDDPVRQTGSGIVLIDEADAHLHPAWQQKFPTLLKDLFPNVQFILSAHSPLFVAGCWRGEVAVLRRLPVALELKGFMIEQLDHDFVGATAAELYKTVFEIEELDGTYLEYATKATLRTEDRSKRIDELSDRLEKGALSEREQMELRQLEEENRRIGCAVEVQQKRQEESAKDLRIEELESKILKLKTKLANTNTAGETS
jgi:predicted ATP-binding protein involved in virulence